MPLRMNRIKLKIGQSDFTFEFKIPPKLFQIKEPEASINPKILKERLQKQLRLLQPDLRQPAIVVGDKTRLCGYQEYLPIVLDTLIEQGAKKEAINLYIAYGTHPVQNENECLQCYGDLYHQYTFVHHDCTNKDSFKKIGVTARGTDAYLRKDIAEASFLMTFGAVSHHYFAGYGGGRKLVFPGLGYKPAIYQNHSLFLDKECNSLSQGCGAGILDGNPLAEDLFAVESFRVADMSVHGILNSKGDVCDLLVGAGSDFFRKACSAHGENCEIRHPDQYDLVLASCGGYPKDINFIQSHKAVHNAAAFVKDGGHLIVLAKCEDGVGSKTFLPWLEMESYQAAFNQLADHYEGNGGTALAMMEKTRRIKISIVTDIDSTTSRKIGFEKISSEQAQERIAACQEPVAVIPNASLLVNLTDSTVPPFVNKKGI